MILNTIITHRVRGFMFSILGVFFLISYSAPSALGSEGWNSGGGSEIAQNARNPWFLHNTSEVEVCLIVDTQYFRYVDEQGNQTTNVNVLKKRFYDAVNYWKEEFSRSWSVGANPAFTVATQEFVIRHVVEIDSLETQPTQACKQSDLRLQFGYLDSEQQEYFSSRLGHHSRYVGATVRTNYDELNLRGRGFIYFKPYHGPLSQTFPQEVNDAWRMGKGYLLNLVLIHELGHVFGIPHIGLQNIMAESFIERVFTSEAAQYSASHQWSNGFFSWRTSPGSIIRDEVYCKFDGYRIRRGWREFLNAPLQHNCYKIFFSKEDTVEFHTGVFGAPDTWTRRGTLVLQLPGTFNWQEAVTLYVPTPNPVLNQTPDGAGALPWLMGPFIKNLELAGTYVDDRSEVSARKVFMVLSPQGLGLTATRFATEIDGKWYWNLDFVN